MFIGRTDAKAETPVLWPPHAELTHWKRLWCWEGLGAEGEGDDRGWDGWMASLTRWTWVWVNSGSWWWTGRPGVLRFMGSQSRTRLSDWTDLNYGCPHSLLCLKWITKKALLSSMWNSARCSVAAWVGGVWGRMDTCVCMAEPLPCSPETINK